ncbi:ABC transporter permease [Streptomyces gramineus]|uniref:ABC transporter permease n=1 Tax=Streptomyces gramineus TaxID=910542 RepID=UPI00398AB530
MMTTETRRGQSRPASLTPARLTAYDVAHVGCAGMRGRPLRVFLSALGIAIGIATLIAVVGISSSSKAQLMRQLDRMGPSMLTITPGQDLLSGKSAELPASAPRMIAAIDGVRQVGAVGSLDVNVYRSEHVPPSQTGGLFVQAASPDLFAALRAELASGAWLNAATGKYPAVVLGAEAARHLGVDTPGQQVYIADRYFTVVGILKPLPLAQDISRSALIGWDAAERILDFDGHPTTIYEWSADDRVEAVRDLLAPTANPRAPEQVKVSKPSDVLEAKAASAGAFSSLLLGLGGVALLVGGVGVANTMIISVLERRHEIGLRRSFGATRGQIRLQFVAESLLLSSLGGAAGVVLGALATYAYAVHGGMPWVIPPLAMAAGFGATLLIGTLAGLYPAVRAALLSPTLALQAS